MCRCFYVSYLFSLDESIKFDHFNKSEGEVLSFSAVDMYAVVTVESVDEILKPCVTLQMKAIIEYFLVVPSYAVQGGSVII